MNPCEHCGKPGCAYPDHGGAPLSFEELAKERMRFVAANRERLVEAWLAETGLLPSESVLVETTSADRLTTTITVRRKGGE